MYMYVLELIKQVVIVPVLHYIFQTANHSPVFPQLNQSKITFCSPLIGPFKFQPLSLVNIQKRISSPSQENILFLLTLVNQKRFCFYLQSLSSQNHRSQNNHPNNSLPVKPLRTPVSSSTLPPHPLHPHLTLHPSERSLGDHVCRTDHDSAQYLGQRPAGMTTTLLPLTLY